MRGRQLLGGKRGLQGFVSFGRNEAGRQAGGPADRSNMMPGIVSNATRNLHREQPFSFQATERWAADLDPLECVNLFHVAESCGCLFYLDSLP